MQNNGTAVRANWLILLQVFVFMQLPFCQWRKHVKTLKDD